MEMEQNGPKGITVKEESIKRPISYIMQEIVRDVPKEYRNKITELVKTKQYEKIQPAIDSLKI